MISREKKDQIRSIFKLSPGQIIGEKIDLPIDLGLTDALEPLSEKPQYNGTYIPASLLHLEENPGSTLSIFGLSVFHWHTKPKISQDELNEFKETPGALEQYMQSVAQSIQGDGPNALFAQSMIEHGGFIVVTQTPVRYLKLLGETVYLSHVRFAEFVIDPLALGIDMFGSKK